MVPLAEQFLMLDLETYSRAKVVLMPTVGEGLSASEMEWLESIEPAGPAHVPIRNLTQSCSAWKMSKNILLVVMSLA